MNGTNLPHPAPATASEIRDIVGRVEDDVVAQILEIGPTGAEVLDACTWLRSDERRQQRLDHELHGRAARVLAILEAALPDSEDGEP
ncbi:hypothetical protein [Paraburkholderia kururiensis]|uniref:Uncharacterized protein n=1 Tax=Paraburkholderia kururiensis TaxID=984307 RepID=A0ABZ0WIQ0_9BURK|nr:hypothetical protein [Paraburkholderia kururiensis]WQD77213.1 hypothetical protein U0042_24630 [Paraburkholderia kururiensis]